jgi:hypothetical protein
MRLQSILPFFVNGAVAVESSPFWNYFMVYRDVGAG